MNRQLIGLFFMLSISLVATSQIDTDQLIRVSAFTTTGFSITVTYTDGDVTDAGQNVFPADIDNEEIIVLYTAYR